MRAGVGVARPSMPIMSDVLIGKFVRDCPAAHPLKLALLAGSP